MIFTQMSPRLYFQQIFPWGQSYHGVFAQVIMSGVHVLPCYLHRSYREFVFQITFFHWCKKRAMLVIQRPTPTEKTQPPYSFPSSPNSHHHPPPTLVFFGPRHPPLLFPPSPSLPSSQDKEKMRVRSSDQVSRRRPWRLASLHQIQHAPSQPHPSVLNAWASTVVTSILSNMGEEALCFCSSASALPLVTAAASHHWERREEERTEDEREIDQVGHHDNNRRPHFLSSFLHAFVHDGGQELQRASVRRDGQRP